MNPAIAIEKAYAKSLKNFLTFSKGTVDIVPFYSPDATRANVLEDRLLPAIFIATTPVTIEEDGVTRSVRMIISLLTSSDLDRKHEQAAELLEKVSDFNYALHRTYRTGADTVDGKKAHFQGLLSSYLAGLCAHGFELTGGNPPYDDDGTIVVENEVKVFFVTDCPAC